jgi:hypothetical protein
VVQFSPRDKQTRRSPTTAKSNKNNKNTAGRGTKRKDKEPSAPDKGPAAGRHKRNKSGSPVADNAVTAQRAQKIISDAATIQNAFEKIEQERELSRLRAQLEQEKIKAQIRSLQATGR